MILQIFFHINVTANAICRFLDYNQPFTGSSSPPKVFLSLRHSCRAGEDATLTLQGLKQQNSPLAEVWFFWTSFFRCVWNTLLLPKHTPFLRSPSHSLNGRFLLCSLHVSLPHKYRGVCDSTNMVNLHECTAAPLAIKTTTQTIIWFTTKEVVFSLQLVPLCWAFKSLKLDLCDSVSQFSSIII